MKKLIAMLMVGGVLAVSTIGCGPAATTAPVTPVTPPSSTTKPAADKPAADKPSADKPAADKPAADKPADKDKDK